MRTVNSIHDFKKGDLIGFNPDGMKFKLGYHDFYDHSLYEGSYSDRKFVVFGIKEFNGEHHLCFDAQLHKDDNFFMIPESELISKGIITPQPAYMEKINSEFIKQINRDVTGIIETCLKDNVQPPVPTIEEIDKIIAKTEHIKDTELKQSLHPDVKMDKEEDLIKQEYKKRPIAEGIGKALLLIDKKHYAPENIKTVRLRSKMEVVEERITELLNAILQVDMMKDLIPKEWLEEVIELNEWKHKQGK